VYLDSAAIGHVRDEVASKRHRHSVAYLLPSRNQSALESEAVGKGPNPHCLPNRDPVRPHGVDEPARRRDDEGCRHGRGMTPIWK